MLWFVLQINIRKHAVSDCLRVHSPMKRIVLRCETEKCDWISVNDHKGNAQFKQ